MRFNRQKNRKKDRQTDEQTLLPTEPGVGIYNKWREGSWGLRCKPHESCPQEISTWADEQTDRWTDTDTDRLNLEASTQKDRDSRGVERGWAQGAIKCGSTVAVLLGRLGSLQEGKEGRKRKEREVGKKEGSKKKGKKEKGGKEAKKKRKEKSRM